MQMPFKYDGESAECRGPHVMARELHDDIEDDWVWVTYRYVDYGTIYLDTHRGDDLFMWLHLMKEEYSLAPPLTEIWYDSDDDSDYQHR